MRSRPDEDGPVFPTEHIVGGFDLNVDSQRHINQEVDHLIVNLVDYVVIFYIKLI